MKKIVTLICITLILSACGGAKQRTNSYQKSTSHTKTPSKKAAKIADYALKFQGTKYKFGGTTKKGMDCSGLVYISFLEENISLPRVSRDMEQQGKRLKISQVTIGDLLFFQTNKNRKVINHVGLVIKTTPSDIHFIHSTTSRGVIVSSLNESYWNQTFIIAKRVL